MGKLRQPPTTRFFASLRMTARRIVILSEAKNLNPSGFYR